MSDIDQSRFNDQHEGWLSSAEASQLLDVKPATLYSYVSRGRVRRVAAPGGRGSLYSRDDLLRLRGRSDARAGHGPAAAEALAWGQPVIDTAVGGIDGGGPIYRGQRATALAEAGARFERVASELIGIEGEWQLLGPQGKPARGGLHDRLIAAVARLARADRHRHAIGRTPQRARAILRALAAAAGLSEGAPRPDLDRALVLCADHGLNTSTTAARITASTGADLYACVIAGLAAHSGPRHGAASARVAVLLAECRRLGAAEALGARLARGEALHGFGHPLYPDGDPRCAPLLALAERRGGRLRLVKDARRLVEAAAEAGYPPPTIDVGLVAAAAALRLGPDGASALFACGRAAGWIAHALEQRQAGTLLRPRARYVGPAAAE